MGAQGWKDFFDYLNPPASEAENRLSSELGVRVAYRRLHHSFGQGYACLVSVGMPHYFDPAAYPPFRSRAIEAIKSEYGKDHYKIDVFFEGAGGGRMTVMEDPPPLWNPPAQDSINGDPL